MGHVKTGMQIGGGCLTIINHTKITHLFVKMIDSDGKL